jgi:hypothetical protein
MNDDRVAEFLYHATDIEANLGNPMSYRSTLQFWSRKKSRISHVPDKSKYVSIKGRSMLWEMFQGLHFLHVLYLIAVASGFYLFWARTRFWLPTYAHVLAGIALVLSIWMMATISDDAPVSKQGPVAKVLLTLALPTMVYFFFVFYGGQHAAYESRFPILTCPHCQQTVAVDRCQNGRTDGKNPCLKRYCANCGQNIGCE